MFGIRTEKELPTASAAGYFQQEVSIGQLPVNQTPLTKFNTGDSYA